MCVCDFGLIQQLLVLSKEVMVSWLLRTLLLYEYYISSLHLVCYSITFSYDVIMDDERLYATM